MSNEMKLMKKQIKDNIQFLIDDNKLDEARSLLNEYYKVISDDVEIYSIKAVIDIMEGKIDEAEKSLKRGLAIDENNFDLNYNLGYLYEQGGEFNEAIRYYKKSQKFCNNQKLSSDIENKTKQIASSNKIDINSISFNPKSSNEKACIIKKVLFIQTLQCIRTYKVAKVLNNKGIQVDMIYFQSPPDKIYKGLDLPYKNIYKVSNINEMIRFINNSDYDILYSSNEPDYLTVLFTCTNKPIVHDTHDMMSLRGDLTNEQIVLEYLANKKSHGNIYVTNLVKNIAIKKFDLLDENIIVYNNYPLREQLPKKFYKKLSSIDGEIHCVYEGGLSNYEGHHRDIGPMFLKLAENKIHVHFYAAFKSEYYDELEKKSKYIHYEGSKGPNELLRELTKYDMGLAILNITEKNKTFLDTTFPNKVWEYLAAELPILFSDLLVFRDLLKNNKVGKIIDFNKNVGQQVRETLNIKIGKNFLNENEFIMDDKADEIIDFLGNVKRNKCRFTDLKLYAKSEKRECFYDQMYKEGGYNKSYFKDYGDTLYINSWKRAIQYIQCINNPQIIEIGCGPGQFANMLFDNNIISYKGIDFSREAIMLAKKRNAKYSELFSVDNAYSSNIYLENYNIAILFEVLEHIDDDISIVRKIKENANIIFSVPNYDSESHVRWFNNEQEIVDRYSNLIDIKDITNFKISKTNVLYLVLGKRK